MDEVIIPPSSGHVGLRFFNPERNPTGELDYFSIEISNPTISGTTRVYAFQSDGLSTLFDEMARDWRGWDGQKKWESLEGELSLSSSSDGKGHILIEVIAQESVHPDSWRIKAMIMIEAGQIDRYAKQISFFLAGGWKAV